MVQAFNHEKKFFKMEPLLKEMMFSKEFDL